MPAGALAVGDAVAPLARRVRADSDGLTGVMGTGVLVVLGAKERLPWVDGVVYIAPDLAVPRLWFGVHDQPTVPCEWLERRLTPGRWLLWQGLAIALDDAGPIDTARLPT